ncbi:MAG: hypothetical protein BWK80_62260 [Desulfobacteraceae bacterium IS3]|nr:MAG: hypothetical protein BWK80_62260 [Desulfobacteraceae bacterium IS3]
MIGVDLAPVFFELIHAYRQITHGCQRMARLAVCDAAGVLAEGNIAAVVDAVFDRRPMSANPLLHLFVAMFIDQATARVIGDGIGSVWLFGVEHLAFSPHGDDLPTAEQADLCGCHR